MAMIPILETERLILRAHTLDDIEALVDMWSDPQVVHYIGGVPFSAENSWSRLLRYVGHWQLLDFGYWVVKEKTTGRFMGEMGLADYHREIEPSLVGMAEMGWVLLPEFHGRGYAQEAIMAILNWAEAHLKRDICCLISPDNHPSIRLAKRCGFNFWCESDYARSTVHLFCYTK